MVDKSKFAAEEAEGYKLTVYGKSVHVTEGMKNYLKDKLAKIERFHKHIMDIHVTMDIQRLEHAISILIKLDHLQIKVSASSSDMYASIDEAVNRLQQKIRRWKERIQDHTAKSRSFVDMTVNVLRKPYNYVEEINAEIEQQKKKDEIHEIISNDKIPLKMLTTHEALMKMELSDDDFLLFKGEEDQKLKLIYRRADGNYGLIVPQ